MNALKNKKVLLRAAEPADIDFLYAIENDISNWELSDNVMPLSNYAIEQHILSLEQDVFAAKQLRLIIISQDTQEPQRIGSVELFDINAMHRRAGIGIIILENFRKKGYAAATLELMLKYAFDIIGLHQIYCNIIADNRPSLNLFKKLGFEVCGLKKHWIFSKNTFKDVYMLQIINNMP